MPMDTLIDNTQLRAEQRTPKSVQANCHDQHHRMQN